MATLTGRPSAILRQWSRAMRDPHDGTEPDVRCGTCSACCRSGYTIDLQDHESGEGLDVVEHEGGRVLRKNPDGSCVHVTPTGCGVYERRPITCRRFDCRIFGIAGLIARGAERSLLNAAALSWEFDLADDAEVAVALAFRQAAHRAAQAGKSVEGAITTAAAELIQRPELVQQAYEEWLAAPEDWQQAQRASLAVPGGA